MSGGEFDYNQYKIEEIADEIEEFININDSEDGRHYSSGTILKFYQAVQYLRAAATMVQRVDYLVSGDDGEESFHRRWDEELNKGVIMNKKLEEMAKKYNVDIKELSYRMDGRIEWHCGHGIGHTIYSPNDDYIHGCDGCCSKLKIKGESR